MEFASRRATISALALAMILTAPGACHRRRAAAPPGPGQGAATPTHTLRGRVVDTAGRAVPGARVLEFAVAEPRDAGGAPDAGTAATATPRQTTTDADGRFTLDHLLPGHYRLLVEATGLASAQSAPLPVPGPDALMTLTGQGQSLTGQVVAAGAPARGARVQLGGEGVVTPRETLSRDDGGFVFHGLGPGTYALRATREGLASAAVSGVPTDGAAPPSSRPRLELGPAAVVTGMVTDDTGRALPAADVRAEVAADDPFPVVARSGPGGRFRVGPLPPGEYRLVARAPGFVSRGPSAVSVRPGLAPPPQRLELVRGAGLQGRVVDARGLPVAGARVRARGAGLADLTVLFEPLPLAAEAAALGPGAGHALGSTRAVDSDVDGRFVVADLLPGRVHLEITHAPAAPLGTEDWTLSPGQLRDVGVLTLRDGLVVRGRVLDERASPLAGAHVTVVPEAGVFAVTAGSGEFQLSLPPGPHTLAVSAPGFSSRSVSAEAAEGAPAVDVKLARADGTLEGLARDSGGRPLAHARVRAWTVDPGREGDAAATAVAPTSVAVAGALTDAGGHFTLARVPRQPLLVEVAHPAYPTVVQPATPGPLVVVAVPIPGGIDGEVRERATGAVVPRFAVLGAGPQSRTATATATSKGGGFKLPRLAPGRWTLSATAPGFRPAQREVDVPPSPVLGEASVRGLRLELEPLR